MDLCHLKNSELEPQFQKYNGRVVLRGDIVKDDSGAHAVFTEQGSWASQMTTAELEPKLQKCGGRLVLRGDMVKDDSGAYAVFTGQGSSASQVTAAEVVDVVARLPDCDGQAADSVSAYTEAKLDDAPRLLKTQMAKHPGQTLKIPWYVSNEIYMDIHWQDCFMGKTLR